MAVCWKVSWKVDPLPLSVPLRLPDDPPPLELLDELQAVSDKAIAARAAPAITTPWLRTRCMLDIPSRLPAECCKEDGLEGVQAGFGLAEDHANGHREGLADGFTARGLARVIHHFPAGRGPWIMGRGPMTQVLDLGIVVSTPRSRR